MTPLVWHNSSVEGLIEAASTRPLPSTFRPIHATDTEISQYAAHYTIEEDTGFRPGRPDATPGFLLSIVYDNDHDDVHAVDLGRHYRTQDNAKAAAERYEHTGDVYSCADHLRYRDVNLDAQFLPQDAEDDTTRPCLHLGGVQVYAYLHERTGQLVISVHLDTADAALLTNSGCVPVRVCVGDTTVFED